MKSHAVPRQGFSAAEHLIHVLPSCSQSDVPGKAGSSCGLDYLVQFSALIKPRSFAALGEEEGSSTIAKGQRKGPHRKTPLPPSYPSPCILGRPLSSPFPWTPAELEEGDVSQCEAVNFIAVHFPALQMPAGIEPSKHRGAAHPRGTPSRCHSTSGQRIGS